MGVLDFLAQAGNRTAVGNVAQALGGKTQGQTTRDDWIDNQIPAIANRINQATTHDEIVKGMQDFVAGGLKAGIDPERLNKLTDSLVGPALRNLGANEIGKITNQLGPQTEPITPQVAPEGQGQPLPANTSFTPQTTPGRPYNQADAFKLAEIEGRTGVKPPANLAALLQAPAAIASHEASTRKTEQELQAQQAKEAAYGDLPTTEIPGTGVNVRTAGRLGALGGFITSQQPQRAPQELPSQQALREAQTDEARARAARARRPPEPKAATGGTQAMKDFITMGGDPNDEPAFMEFLAKRAKAQRKPTEMETYLQNRGGGKPAPATPGKKRSLEEIAREAFK